MTRLSREAATESEGGSQRRQAARQRAVREKVERLEQALEQLQQIEANKTSEAAQAQARVSESEPEARRQRESNGGWATGFNAQLATDAKHKIVVGVELSALAADAPQLEATLADVEQRLEQQPRQVLADAGYNSRANIAALEEAKIELATPAPVPEQGSRAAARAAGIGPGYEAKFFVWDEQTKSYQCPAGKRLEYRRTSHKRGRVYRQYQANGPDCKQCEQRLKCCPNSFERGRLLSRAAEDELMARHREWMQSERARELYRRRSEIAEFPHAWLKERFGVRKFRVRGLRKARAELLWALLAYNVQQWVRLVWRSTLGTPDLMMATA